MAAERAHDRLGAHQVHVHAICILDVWDGGRKDVIDLGGENARAELLLCSGAGERKAEHECNRHAHAHGTHGHNQTPDDEFLMLMGSRIVRGPAHDDGEGDRKGQLGCDADNDAGHGH